MSLNLPAMGMFQRTGKSDPSMQPKGDVGPCMCFPVGGALLWRPREICWKHWSETHTSVEIWSTFQLPCATSKIADRDEVLNIPGGG